MWFTGSTVAILRTNQYQIFRIVTANLKLRICRVLTNDETQFSNFNHFSCFQTLKILSFLYCHFSCVFANFRLRLLKSRHYNTHREFHIGSDRRSSRRQKCHFLSLDFSLLRFLFFPFENFTFHGRHDSIAFSGPWR